ncbi:MAG: response regulator [Candidatus Latescibacteria bacterium]|nr:response regulator [Candidatus Latescibacterota bacterium]
MEDVRILIVDDEVDLARSCQRLLDGKGYTTARAATAEEAQTHFDEAIPQLVITDLKMPGMGGMELLRWVKSNHADVQVVIMTAYSTIEDAVEAMRLGAVDFVPKPFTPGHLSIVVEKALVARTLRQENRHLKEQLSQQYSFDNIIGRSPAMKQVFESVKKIASTQLTALITGASGTGKELIARSIHANSDRSNRAFVAINCGALPENLVESEIFGYEKGAFSGAVQAKAGLLETADGGSFFMDEISELPLPLQVKFLRVLEGGKFRRVGSTQERQVDIRLICAANRDLETLVEAEQFREDLYYRINTFTIYLPALKERGEDLVLLADTFLGKYAAQHGKVVKGIAPEAMALLNHHEWRGNVRELEHVIERAVVLAAGELVQPDDLPPNIQQASAGASGPIGTQYYLDLPFKEAKERLITDFERRYIQETLQKYRGNVSRSAAHIGIDRRSLHRLLAKYELVASRIGKEEVEAES